MQLHQVSFGQVVRYLPTHAQGDLFHPDAELGIVSSKNDKVVFVKFHKELLRRGWEFCTSRAVNPEDLDLLYDSVNEAEARKRPELGGN